MVFDDPGGVARPEGAPRLTPVQKVLSEVGLYPTGGHLVKRVIGVGGDRVEVLRRQGRVTVNGVPLTEKSYIMKGADPSDRDFDVKVPTGPAVGDGRQPWQQRGLPLPPGPARRRDRPGDDVVGKVWAIVWPFGRAHLLHEPATFENPKLRATDH